MSLLDLLLRPLMSARVTSKYPRETDTPHRGIRGTPALVAERCERLGDCQAACPTGAISLRDEAGSQAWQLDYGLCIFCGLCVQACTTGAIITVDDFELAQRRRDDVIRLLSKRDGDA